MMNKHFYKLFLILFLIGGVQKGLCNELVLTEYSYRDGLTTNIVNSTFRDSKGFLWISSINGLYRFDGYNFHKINTQDKLLNGEVLSVYEDKAQNLWICSAKKGIIFYNTHSDEIFPLRLNIKLSYSINKICLLRNKVWLASDSGLIVFDQEKNYTKDKIYSAKIILPEPSNAADQRNKITYFYASADSTTLWIGTNGGLFFLNTDNFVLKGIHSHPQNAVRTIIPYHDKILVGSWDGGVYLVNPQTYLLEKNEDIVWLNKFLIRKRVISACYDSENQLWIGTYGDGLYRFNIQEKSYIYLSYQEKKEQHLRLKSDVINHIQYDKSGILWVSMNQPALTKIYHKKGNIKIYDIESYFTKKSFEISSMVRSNIFENNVWIGTNRSGLIRYDFTRHKLFHYSADGNTQLKLPSNEISFIYEDQQGNLWIVHRLIGLYIVPAQMLAQLSSSGKIIKPIEANILFGNSWNNSYITSFYEDSKGRLWLGLWGGLYVLDLNKNLKNAKNEHELKERCCAHCIFSDVSPELMPFPISPTQAIVEVGKNRYFIGTRDEGIIEITEKGNSFSARIAKDINQLLPSDFVRCFYKTNDNDLWIGTNAGVCLYNIKTRKLEHWDENDGLSSNNVNHILADSRNNIWLSSSYGITKLTATNFQVKNYIFETEKNSYNYLISSAYAKLANNFMNFSTNKAIISFHPDSLNDSINTLPFLFTNIKINNEAINPNMRINGRQIISSNVNECNKINVPYKTNLTLEFAALDFHNSDKIRYKYKMNSSDWISLDRNQRSISFYNQNPGEYTLQIMALHPTGYKTFRTVKLLFLPPWWKTGWAYTLYGLIFIILFISYRNLIVNRIRQQAKIEQEQFERLKIEELDKLKTNFLTNISHEIRTPLSLIINPLETLVKDPDLSSDAKNKIAITLKNSYRLVKLTNELSDFTRIEKEIIQPDFKQYNFIETIKDAYNSFSPLAVSTHIDFQLYCSFDELYMCYDKAMIEKVIFNLLSNAFKFTPKYGAVIIEVARAEQQGKHYAKVSVTNTGSTIPQDKLEKIFDRFYQIDSAQHGLGIGLSIVKSFVEMHQGTIRVRSAGSETCFDVLIPTDILPNAEENVDKPHVELSAQEISSYNSPTDTKKLYKVLIIEDDEEIRKYIMSELANAYKTFGAADGEEGLRIATNIMPDIIITDIVMPGIDGIEVCQRLRNDISTSHIPIIILSAKSSTNQQIEGLNAGANMYLVKPFNIYILKNQVDRLIQLKESIHRKILKEAEVIPEDAIENDLDKQFIDKVLQYIEHNMSNSNLSVDELAHHVCLSKVQLYRKVKAITGLSVIEFIMSVRLKTAARLILQNNMSYAQIAYETGFSSPSYFTKCFREHFGKTPSEYAAMIKK